MKTGTFLRSFLFRFQADYLLEMGIMLSHMKTNSLTWFSTVLLRSHLTEEISKIQNRDMSRSRSHRNHPCSHDSNHMFP